MLDRNNVDLLLETQLGLGQRSILQDQQTLGLDRRGVLGSQPNCGGKGRVGANPDIGHEKMAQARPGPDQRCCDRRPPKTTCGYVVLLSATSEEIVLLSVNYSERKLKNGEADRAKRGVREDTEWTK